MKRLKPYYAALLIAGGIVAGCAHQSTLVEVPATLMHYQHKPTEAKLLTLAKSYAEAINHNLEQQNPCPGQYADYGVALARLGCAEQANVMFNNEKFLFPNSSLYIDKLKQSLVPAYCTDNHTDTSRINIKTLDTIKITYTPEEEAILRQQADDPAFKQMLKEQAKIEREQQAEMNRKAKAEREKARKAEQRAQAKEREAAKRAKAEQQKAEREAIQKEREAAQKAKAEQKKAEQKAMKEAQKAKEKAEKEAQKAKEKAEKEARKAQQKAEREAQKAEKARLDSIARAEKELNR